MAACALRNEIVVKCSHYQREAIVETFIAGSGYPVDQQIIKKHDNIMKSPENIMVQ